MSLPAWPPCEASSTEGETCAVEEVARGELGMPAPALRGRRPALSRRRAAAEPPPLPATAIYSRSDGICAWQNCLEEDAPQTENIEVRASHCGLGHHPAAIYAIADRLAQRLEQTQRELLAVARGDPSSEEMMLALANMVELAQAVNTLAKYCK